MILDLKNLREGQMIQSNIVLIKSYNCRPYSDGQKRFITGNLYHKGVIVPFKVWDAPLVNLMRDYEFTNKIVDIDGSVVSYKGSLEVHITRINLDHNYNDMSLFLKSVDVESVYKNFVDFINDNLSPEAILVLDTIFKGENLHQSFSTEFAGSKVHDAQVGGLMNHTLKMLNLAKMLITNDSRLIPYKDLIYLGIVFHDMGKIYELKLGEYTENSFVTHRLFGIELLAKYKECITKVFNERFYYHLQAIIQGHHGEFGEKPKTVWAYIIHLIDMLEATTTMVLDSIETNNLQEYRGSKTLYINNEYLTI